MIQKKNIFKLAEKVKKTIGEKKKLPTTFTIENTTYTWMQVWYILSYAIVNLNKDLDKVPKIKKCDKPTGNKINEKIKPDDYISQAKRILKYIKENGKCPNFVTTLHSKKKISPKLSIYEEARIVVFYYNKHILPSYCTYQTEHVVSTSKKSSSPIIKKIIIEKKHGHATKNGCDNMGQNTPYYCGCHSLQEVFRNLTGIVVPQSTIAKWAGTTSSGTGHEGLNTAVAKFNKVYDKNLKVKWEHFSNIGWSGLNKIINSSDKDFVVHNLYRNKWGHYEVVNSIPGAVNTQNSLGSSCGSCYCGYKESRSKAEFQSYIKGISQKSIMIITRG